jgi:hypothetical protein
MLLLALLIAAAPLPPLVGPTQPQPDLPPPPARDAPVMAPLVAEKPFFNALAKGTTGVSFGLPGNVPTATIGATYFLANNVALRADLGINAIFTSGGTATFSVDLALRLYQWRVGALAIYVAPDFAFARTAVSEVEAVGGVNATVATGNGVESISFGGDLGVEYFLFEHLSIGGQLGMALTIGNLGGNSTVVGLSTATSGLFVSAYF